MSISVVMPAYNENETLDTCVKRVLDQACVNELIIVDDGSKDGTREKIKQWADEESRIKASFHAKNGGKGAALHTGFRIATGDIIIIQDADLEYDPTDYQKLLTPLLDGRADVVYGSRFLGGPHRVHLFWHWLGNRFLTLICNMLANLNLTDMETCYKAFKKSVLDNITLKATDFGFEPEFTIKIARAGYIIYETPISYAGRNYSDGKKITWHDAYRALYYMFYFRFFKN